MATFLHNEKLLSFEKGLPITIVFHLIVIGHLFLNSNHGTMKLTRLDHLLLIKHETLHVTFVLDTCIK